jgi:hypothetical protein
MGPRRGRMAGALRATSSQVHGATSRGRGTRTSTRTPTLLRPVHAGLLFLFWGAYWLLSILRVHLTQQRSRGSRGAGSAVSRPWYPFPLWANVPLEPLVKILLPTLGVFVELSPLGHGEWRCGTPLWAAWLLGQPTHPGAQRVGCTTPGSAHARPQRPPPLNSVQLTHPDPAGSVEVQACHGSLAHPSGWGADGLFAGPGTSGMAAGTWRATTSTTSSMPSCERSRCSRLLDAAAMHGSMLQPQHCMHCCPQHDAAGGGCLVCDAGMAAWPSVAWWT